ncbi:glycosyltransferase [Capnocytophaga bilenii]|jgi:glycosyltransferase, family 2
MTKVKILLATYNGELYITQQIESIISQEGVIVDIIINDDGSNDTTVSKIKASYPTIKIKENIPPTGAAANNFLKMISELDFTEKFEYIALSDQDDVWLPQKLLVATNILENEKYDLYCSNLTKWNMESGKYSLLKKDYPQKRFDYLFEGGSAGCTYVLTKYFAKKLKDLISQIDFKEWGVFSHDWFIYFFARSNDYKVFIDKNSYIHYRIHNNNVHGYLNQLSLKTIKIKIDKVLKGYYQSYIKNHIKCLKKGTLEYKIYQQFLGNYFQRNWVVLRYNFQLMRSKKKYIMFLLLNLLQINNQKFTN